MEIIQKGYLEVGNGHELYYENCGNPSGEKIVFLHGGPGSGFSDRDKIFFDPTQINLLLLDQRGCGRSRFSNRLENNTTADLIQDIIQLLDFHQMEQVILFGGSWGSTLALLFAIKHPGRVKGLILRGVFTGSIAARNYFENGGTQLFFPEAWERYCAMVPEENRNAVSAYYFEQLLALPEGTLRKKLAYELMYYGFSLSKKVTSTKQAVPILNQSDFETKVLVLAHFSQNNFFIPDNYILQNLIKIEDLPIRIVHGQYDMICPPFIAYELHQRLKNSKLDMVDGGHSPREEAIQESLKLAVVEMIAGFKKQN